MTPEILAKIMGIVAKTGDRVIVLDPRSGAPFALMSLEAYEKLVLPPLSNPVKAGEMPSLTSPAASGMIDPNATIWQEVAKGAGDWGGDEEKGEEDRYYMEPTE